MNMTRYAMLVIPWLAACFTLLLWVIDGAARYEREVSAARQSGQQMMADMLAKLSKPAEAPDDAASPPADREAINQAAETLRQELTRRQSATTTEAAEYARRRLMYRIRVMWVVSVFPPLFVMGVMVLRRR